MSFLVNISRTLIDWIIPQSCLLCGDTSNQSLCSPCYRDLPWLRETCDICALPLESGGTCAECLDKGPSFDCCYGVFQFTNPVGPLLNQFKHRRNFRNGKVLSAALANKIHAHYRQQDLPECIVPVPLHWRRLVWRGFNQATFIGQEIGRKLDLSVKSILKRSLATTKQQGLDRKQRLKNLTDAFVVNGTATVTRQTISKQTIPKHVALVDDVMTTGATAEAASIALKRAGVARVDVWVIARTPSP
jgi:ComF family protein